MIQRCTQQDVKYEIAKKRAIESLLCAPAGVSAPFFPRAGGWRPPVVSSLDVASGNDYGGDTVVIAGTGFTGATAVKIGTFSATSVTVNSSTQITIVTGVGTASATPYDVTVYNPGAYGTLAGAFTYFSIFTNLSGGQAGYRYENATVSGGKVSSWTDQFGSNHAIQATSGNQPLYTSSAVAGHAALEYSGGQLLATTSNISLGTYTILVSFKASSTAGVVFEQSVNAATNPGIFFYTSSVYASLRKGSTGNFSARDAATNWGTDNTWRSIIVVCDGTNAGHLWYINNALGSASNPLTSDPGAGASNDKFYIGARSGVALPTTGMFCDFAVFNSVISSTERARADKWMRGRVGL